MRSPNWLRCSRLIDEAISNLAVDLTRLRVLTEASTGYYALTPIIAALAGADEVFTLTRDTMHGRADDIQRQMHETADYFGVSSMITRIEGRDDARIADADVVTNLGHVRPLDAELLRRLKSTAAIALMFETWEFRPEDLDLAAARELGIPVLGTNERHPRLRTLEYVGHLAAKLLYENDIEILGCRIAVIGDDKFGAAVNRVLRSGGADVLSIDPSKWSRRAAAFEDALPKLDALVVAEHQRRYVLVGGDGLIEPADLRRGNPGILLVHIAGGVDQDSLTEENIRCVPGKLASAGRMSLATDYVGPKPMIDLHAAGLRVGAELTRLRLQGFSAREAEQLAVQQCTMCQAFDASNPNETNVD